MKRKTAIRASACEANRRRAGSSHSSVAKKLSHMALSYASPTDPIDGRTPASLQRLPNASDVYWAESTGRRNTTGRNVAMAGRRRSDRALRDKLRSPGRPGMARREDRLRFWALIAAGLSSEDAAIGAGVSPPIGTRWFREAGGMPSSTFTPSSKPLSGRYLAFAEREEIALALAQDFGVREIARRLGRAASTVSRELRRNGTLSGRHVDQSVQNLRSTRRCGRMCRIGWPARSLPRTELRFAGRSCRGRDAGMGRDRSGDGVWRGSR